MEILIDEEIEKKLKKVKSLSGPYHNNEIKRKNLVEYQFGSGNDVISVKSLEHLLDSNEKGILMELEEKMLNSMREFEDKYDIVGKIIEEDYPDLIEKLRAGICDDIALVPSDSLDNLVEIIRYKDREYGERIRKYHLTKRGFLMNIIFFEDED